MRPLRTAIALLLPILIGTASSAVLIDGLDGDRDVSPFPISELDNIGLRGGACAIYLGNGIVLTASHVGAGSVAFGGVVYPYVPGTAVQLGNGDGTYADLVMFQIHPRPDLPALPIAAETPLYGSLLVVVGNGVNRGVPLLWDPNGQSPPGPTAGFAWAPGNTLRWGTNGVELFPAGRIFGTQTFGSFFDAGRLLPEAQAVTGDSGGAAFTLSPLGNWQLSGVIIGIMLYSGQPTSTTFFGQRTYYADLAYYQTALQNAVALPEPGRMLAPGVALVLALAWSRRAGQLLQPPLSRRDASASRSVLSLPNG
jgi:hypothetical protein